MKQYKEIIYEKEDGIAIITLNRPDRLNAIGWSMRLELPEAIEDVQRDANIRVLILTGAGRGFCAGGDVKGQMERTQGKVPEEVIRAELREPVGSFGLALHNLGKPTIAAVNGVAVGAGLSLALLCDLRIASEEARFSVRFTQAGLSCDTGLSYALPKVVGMGKALELMLLNDLIDAKEAERIGLVSKVVPANDLMKVAKEIARKIADSAPIATQMMKQVAYLGFTNDLEDQLRVESDAVQRCQKSQDHREAAQAFLEKRTPIFKGM